MAKINEWEELFRMRKLNKELLEALTDAKDLLWIAYKNGFTNTDNVVRRIEDIINKTNKFDKK